jgi:hypothetical protein
MYFAFHRTSIYILLSPFRLAFGHSNIICCRVEDSCVFQIIAGRYKISSNSGGHRYIPSSKENVMFHNDASSRT